MSFYVIEKENKFELVLKLNDYFKVNLPYELTV